MSHLSLVSSRAGEPRSSDFRLLIGGRAVEGASIQEVVNPATGRGFTYAPRANLAQLNQAVAAAKVIFPAWSTQSIKERRRLLYVVADALKARHESMARMLVLEHGKPYPQATQ